MTDTNPDGTATPDLTYLNSQKVTPPPPHSGVRFCRQEVREMLDTWKRIQAAIEGEDAVRALGEQILPRPNPADRSVENLMRYDAYIKRAVWYNVSARTLLGLTGYVFAAPPILKLPDTLKSLENNVDGNGVTVAQQSKTCLTRILAKGRCGLLVDYPKVEGAVTKQDLLDGKVSPTILLYEPENIINWRTEFKGSQTVLELLVLSESYIDEEARAKDEFVTETKTQYRVLKREEGVITGEIYRAKADGGEFERVPDLDYKVIGSDGKPFETIPFIFVGAVNNDETIDVPPLRDIVSLNFAHFRNSADYEESCYTVGQPTPWISGLSEQWVNEVLKGTVRLGSRAVLPLPIGGQAGLLQVEPNSMPLEAMKLKETQMTALGAKLIIESQIMRTATEVTLDHSAETSLLSAAAGNVFLAYKAALKICGRFVGSEDVDVTFQPSQPISKEPITQDVATALVLLWQQNLADFDEVRAALRKTGVAYKENDDVKKSTGTDGKPPEIAAPAPAPTTTPKEKAANPTGTRV